MEKMNNFVIEDKPKISNICENHILKTLNSIQYALSQSQFFSIEFNLLS